MMMVSHRIGRNIPIVLAYLITWLSFMMKCYPSMTLSPLVKWVVEQMWMMRRTMLLTPLKALIWSLTLIIVGTMGHGMTLVVLKEN